MHTIQSRDCFGVQTLLVKNGRLFNLQNQQYSLYAVATANTLSLKYANLIPINQDFIYCNNKLSYLAAMFCYYTYLHMCKYRVSHLKRNSKYYT